MPEDVQPGFRAFVARVGGDDGGAWIASLPARIEAARAVFGIEVGVELPGGLLACVLEARTADGREVVLKLPSPWARGPDEVAALRAWRGRGAPELLADDSETGAILLERVRPGAHPAAASAADVTRLLGLLGVPPPGHLPSLGAIVAGRLANAEADGRATLQRLTWARDALAGLEQEPPPPSLVHGDFDERNLLTCERRGLCAIDPLACAGDPLYDAAYWIHGNRRPGRRARFDALAAALRLDEREKRRLRDWCGVIAVHG